MIRTVNARPPGLVLRLNALRFKFFLVVAQNAGAGQAGVNKKAEQNTQVNQEKLVRRKIEFRHD